MHLPPLDAHAHVIPSIDSRELRALHSVIFAVTREPREWDGAAGRRDEQCVWGLGCHPRLPAAVAEFDRHRLASAVEQMPLIGEVGLDRGSVVSPADQQRTFRAALEIAKESSRLVSIHSTGAASEVLSEIEKVGGVPGAILHWWGGDAGETLRAVKLNCYFSLNGAAAARPDLIRMLPMDRVLTETDYPHTRRIDEVADRPGAVTSIEAALSRAWGVSAGESRRQVWKNLANICTASETWKLLPRRVQGRLLSVRGD